MSCNNVIVSGSCPPIVISQNSTPLIVSQGNKNLTVAQNVPGIAVSAQDPADLVVDKNCPDIDIRSYSTISIVSGNSAFLTTTGITGEDIEAFRVIAEVGGEFFYADVDDPDHISSVLGISLTPGLAGETIEVAISGIITFAGFSFDTSKGLYLDRDGFMTQTPDFNSAHFFVQIGDAPTANSVFLHIEEPTLLG